MQARLAYTATVVGSYAEAEKLATIWGTPVSDTSIHQCVQELGPQAQKLVLPTPVPAPREAPFDLVLMMDGWLTRERGPDWSAGPRKKNPERVEWKEIKSAVIYRLEQRAENASGRGLLLEKHVVATPPDTSPLDFGQAVRDEAMRRGLARAKTVYLVMDGAVWLWDLAEDRFKLAVKTLDFHHAREHLNTIAEALYGIGTQRAKDWLAEQVKSVRHGDEALVVNRLEDLLQSQAQAKRPTKIRKTIAREVKYFRTHRDHISLSRPGKRRCSPGQWRGRIPRQTIATADARLWPVLGTIRFVQLAQAERAGEKRRPPPPLELTRPGPFRPAPRHFFSITQLSPPTELRKITNNLEMHGPRSK